jgi:hypothetical protein
MKQPPNMLTHTCDCGEVLFLLQPRPIPSSGSGPKLRCTCGKLWQLQYDPWSGSGGRIVQVR